MPEINNPLFNTVNRTDPLNFWSNHGLDYNRVTDFLDFDKNELSKIAGISKQSVRLDERIPKALKDRLDQLANICAHVAVFFDGDPERTALWFKTSNPMLGEISPRDMIRFGRYKKLMNIVMQSMEANKGNNQSD